MNAIIDSGSTKSDWVIIGDDNEEKFRTHTKGFNPYFINAREILAALKENEELVEAADEIKHIFFYGAGCSSERMCAVVQKAFDEFFPNSNNHIDHDLKAAAYTAYNGKPTVACILGTGSNSCFFDGENLYEACPSLSYILGDEGSGNHLGRELLRNYFTNKLPKHLARAFDERYNLTIGELNKRVYQEKFANTYLATFSRFVADHKYEPFIQQMVYKCLKDFFVYQVLPYKEAASSEVNFIGSVAFYYDEILGAVANEFNMKIGKIVKKPINDLVNYHKMYIFPKINE